MDANKRYASSTDVARLAGVSQSAVSRTYKVGGRVSEETRQKVLAAAEQLNYRPSLIPQIMLSHRSNLVAVVIGGMHNPFYSELLEDFTMKLQQTENQVLLVHADSGHAFDEIVPRLASYRVDAIVSGLSILSDSSAAELAKLKIPVVSFNTHVTNEWVSSVCCNNLLAAKSIADLFLERGARSFGFISGPSTSPASEDRHAGYRDRLRECGVTKLSVIRADYRYEEGFGAAIEMFQGRRKPDAIFCANDLIAMGAIDAIRKSIGLRVPEDVLIAGFDDIPAASWSAYDLTTFVQDGPRMVDEALAILAAANASPTPVGGICKIVDACLVERGTTEKFPIRRRTRAPARADLVAAVSRPSPAGARYR
jgi:DNA-binding LacI/PurR family transcriptional regulator